MTKTRRALLVAVSALLLVVMAVGGTIAYLKDNTDPVTNTFTVGNIDITLTETGTDEDGNKSYKMVPGATLDKDPKVTVESGSEKCWVFIQITESDNLDSFISYTINAQTSTTAGWVALGETYPGVYYWSEVIDASTADVELQVLAGDTVTVKSDVTKAMMDALAVEGATLPSLAFKAYAVQSENLTVTAMTDIWTIATAE